LDISSSQAADFAARVIGLSIARKLKPANAASVAPQCLGYRHFRRRPDRTGTPHAKCYIVTLLTNLAGIGMTHHHHGPGAHPSPTLAPSLLRLSALQRLAVAGFLIALIWAAAFWAIN
jgi:hypothetical protein